MTDYRLIVDEPWDSEPLKFASISRALEIAFPGYLVGCYKVDPENDRKDRTKIDAIKRVREILKCSLYDAKGLADSAQQTGFSRWANVRVYSYSQPVVAGERYHTYQVMVIE